MLPRLLPLQSIDSILWEGEGCGSTEFALGSVGDWLVPNIEDRPWFSGVGCKEVRLDLLLPFLGGGTSFIHGINSYIR